MTRTKCEFCPEGGGLLRLTEYISNRGRPELLAQWDKERNLPLSPGEISSGSERKVWWRCERGHNWMASITSRVSLERGCPYCASQRVISGETDLVSRYPEVARRWHPNKNGATTPDQIMPHTHKRYWWRCEKGHEWQVSPSALIQGSGCPYCAGKKAIPGQTDLVTLRPDLATEWHPEKNGKLTAQQVSPGSTKKVWWLCGRGHPYQSYVFSRSEGTGCPYCAGKKVWPGFNDLATCFPHLAQQWHASLNGELSPQDVTKGSHKLVWWECQEGHVWKAAVFSRTRAKAANCPVCAGTQKKKAVKA